MDTTEAIDPAICPLCGKANHCAMVEGRKDCWCCDVEMPKAVLERIPEAARGVACICRECATTDDLPGDSRERLQR